MNHFGLKKLIRLSLIFACLSLTGCGCMQSSVSGNQNSAQIESLDTMNDVKPLDVGAVLECHNIALNSIETIKAALHAGESTWFERDALHNAPESLLSTLANAATSQDEAASLKLAIALYEMSRINGDEQNKIAQNVADQDNAQPEAESYRERYAQASEKILKRLKSKSGPDSINAIIPDVIEYYMGSIALARAEAKGEADGQKDALEAYSAFSRAKTNRTSSFYHLAAEGSLKACILAGDTCQAEDAARTFMATYPDYPSMPALRLAYAKLLIKHDKLEQAQTTLDALTYDYPWTEAADEAAKLMKTRNWTPRERSYDETLAHVDFLRKKRFWKLAEIAATSALEKYPDDVQLLLQDARIQYEQSYHEASLAKFQHLYDVLDGEKKDGIRPAGVIAYMYRAAGYMGDCKTALELLDKNLSLLGRKDRQKAKLDYALTCGALDVMWENAVALKDTLDPYDFGFYAYLAREYETAREKLNEAANALSGTQKRRAIYFYAMATLKSALAKAEAELKAKQEAELNAKQEAELNAKQEAEPLSEAANANDSALATETPAPVNATESAAQPTSADNAKSSETETITHTDKLAKKKSSSKSKKTKTKTPARPTLPEATVELAQKSFRAIIS